MSSEWDRGVLNQTSWHKLETLAELITALDLINAGETSGAWPIEVFRNDQHIKLEDGLVIPGIQQAIVGRYKNHSPRSLGNVGGRFKPATPEKWRDLIHAAVGAGAKPSGAFSLRNGSRIIATFEIGEDNGLKHYLVLADAFDGSIKFMVGFTSIRVVCANTLSAAIRSDGKGLARLSHTQDINERIEILQQSMVEAIETGNRVSDLYQRALDHKLQSDDAMELLFKLYPSPPEDAKKASKTRVKNKRKAALEASALSINKVGDGNNAATIWNAATFLVDRKLKDGKTTFRSTKSSDRLDSMLFGTRATKVAEIEQVMVQLLRPDGTEESVPVDQAIAAGVPAEQIGGNNILQDIINELK